MAERGAGAAVLAAGLLQGVALVAFPASSSELTASRGFGLSATEYGLLFVPQVLLAIAAALTGGPLGRRFGVSRLLLIGLGLDALSMAVFALSGFALSTDLGYPLLLVATAALGAGFGYAVPAMNTVQAELHPDARASAGLTLNALLGLGTALAPAFAAIASGLAVWWLLPVVVGGALVLLIPFALRAIPSTHATHATHPPGPAASTAPPPQPDRGRAGFVALGGAALLYGVCETMSGNWAQPLLTNRLGTSAVLAAAALTAFWAAVTVGRVALAGVEHRIKPTTVIRVAPVPIAGAYAVLAVLPHGAAAPAVAAFAVAGLGCAALLPQLQTLAQQRRPASAQTASSRVIALYQIGYGVAAFGVGPLRSLDVSLNGAFGITAVLAAVLAVCVNYAVRAVRSPA